MHETFSFSDLGDFILRLLNGSMRQEELCKLQVSRETGSLCIVQSVAGKNGLLTAQLFSVTEHLKLHGLPI